MSTGPSTRAQPGTRTSWSSSITWPADPNCVTTGGYRGANFFRADLHGAVQWAHIKAGSIGSFPESVNNLVLDNPRATASSGWTPVRTFSNGSFYGDGSGVDTNSFGTNYLAKTRGSGAASVVFRPTIVVPGDYLVYEWHPRRTDASAAVPFQISTCCGTTTVYANQQTNFGNWSVLGRFGFDAGTAGFVRVSDAIPEVNGVALADGVKWVFIPPSAPPPPASNLVASAVSPSQISLTWQDASTNETGFAVWRGTNVAGPFVLLTTLVPERGQLHRHRAGPLHAVFLPRLSHQFSGIQH